MATREDYRTDLETKLLALEDGGYGDFEYTDDQLNTYLDMSVIRMWPSIYRKLSYTVVSDDLVAYGSNGRCYAPSVTADGREIFPADRVFMIDDADEFDPIIDWAVRPDKIANLVDGDNAGGIVVYYYDAYVLPANDSDDAGIPKIYDALINLGAQIMACESRQDTGVRGEPAPTGQFAEVSLLDRLVPQYDKLMRDLGMSLPGVRM